MTTNVRQRGVSLNRAATELRLALGEKAPARITLHRHSNAGLLRSMIIKGPSSSRRVYYDAQALIDHYSAAAGPDPEPAPAKTRNDSADLGSNSPQAGQTGGARHVDQVPPASTPPAPVAAALIDPVETAQAISRIAGPLIAEQIAQALKPLNDLLIRLDRGVSDLTSTRTSLMLKYDAAAALTNQRLEEAKSEIARLRKESDLEQQISRIRIDISRVIDAIGNLQQSR